MRRIKQPAALSPKERAGTAGLALQDRAQSLGVLTELRNGNVEVAQAAAVPTSPSSPKVSRNTILSGALGLLLGLGVAFLLERLDRRIRTPEDLEAIYGLPLLGVVANGLEAGRFDSYGYGYGYGGGYAPAAPERPAAAGASPNGAAPAEAPAPTSQA
jgi:G-rich domain on putative tyrosine kinase